MAFGNSTKGYIRQHSGGGGGGTSNYNQLSNKPQINGVELVGNKSSSDLGIGGVELKELSPYATSPMSFIMPENYTIAIFVFKRSTLYLTPLICPKSLIDSLTDDGFTITWSEESNANGIVKDGNTIREKYASTNMYRLDKVYYF